MTVRAVQIGLATLYLGDCLEVLPTLGPVDAVCTDPPYEIATSGGGIFRRNRDCMDRIAAAGIDKGFDHSTLTSNGAVSVVVFCHNDQLHTLLPFLAAEFDRHAVCQWHKANPMPVANKHYRPDTEFYVHAWNAGGAPIGDLPEKGRYIIAPVGQPHPSGHPTVKPLEVMRKVVRNLPGNVVLDPFMGTGSTGVAVVEAGRSFIGIERDAGYFDWACRRIEDAQRQGNLFGEACTASPEPVQARRPLGPCEVAA